LCTLFGFKALFKLFLLILGFLPCHYVGRCTGGHKFSSAATKWSSRNVYSTYSVVFLWQRGEGQMEVGGAMSINHGGIATAGK